MVNINPTYYAAGNPTNQYRIDGFGFNNIPTNAVGIFSADNNLPLYYINTSTSEWLFDIEVINDNVLIATCRMPNTHSTPNYLGGIVSEDRQTIYWINSTKPLP